MFYSRTVLILHFQSLIKARQILGLKLLASLQRWSQSNQLVHLVRTCLYPWSQRNLPLVVTDVSISITLIDPSNFQSGSGFKVTCFMKANHERFLPTPEVGHVLLLKNVKLSVWQMNVNGVTYPEKLCWVAFSPTTGKLYHKDEAIISARNPAAGLSLAFNPFHLAKGKEITYFVNLGEWWRAIQEEQDKGAIQIQDYTRKGRKHALIGDMDPNVFFNATVEVMHYRRVYSIQPLTYCLTGCDAVQQRRARYFHLILRLHSAQFTQYARSFWPVGSKRLYI